MDYRILGPLEVCDGDRTLELGGDKQRALLAILLLHAGEVVSTDRLIDDLWDERPPPGALRALQAHVSRLRKALDTNGASSLEANGDRRPGSSNGVLVTRGHGYLLGVESGELDLDRFRGLVEEGRQALAAGEVARAARILREGLALWRGPPLADFAYEAFAQAAIAQLEELQLAAVEERVEADLALGGHDQLVGELAALVERHPLRERLRMQLMLGLYRCGRQAEALEVYQEFRRGLSGELGLDPGPGLQQLEVAILNRDPSLAAPVATRRRAAETASPPRSRPGDLRTRSRRRLAVAAAAATVIVIAIAIAMATAIGWLGGGGAARVSAIAADSVGAISPVGGKIGAVVAVGTSPSRLAAGAGAVWVSNYNAGNVSRIDLATHAVQVIPVGSTPGGIAVGSGAVWVANNFGGTVTRIDPKTNTVVQAPKVGNGPSGVAVGDGSVWVTNASDGTLVRIDALTGAVVKAIPLGGGATDVAASPGAVWVSDAAGGRVLRIDPHTNQIVKVITVGTGPGPIAVGYGSVWVANTADRTVSRIDPRTDTVARTIRVGDGPDAIAVGQRGVWVANEFAGSVAQIDPATGDVARTIRVGNRPQGVTVAGGLVWVGAQATATSHRGGTLTVLSHASFDTLDPAFAGTIASVGMLEITNDGLTAFKRVGGSDGATVVPDLATNLPTPSDGGLTYTFQLRPGIRYSNGAPVRPRDFRYALERDFKLGTPYALRYYVNVAGGAACAARPARCDLSSGIVTDDGARRVTFHLVAPDPEFLQRLALWPAVAVPAGTASHAVGNHPLPATGPYQIAQYAPTRQLLLVRNPYFHEWSPAAQPDGYPDRIVYRIGASTTAAVTGVERGSADYTLDGPPPDRVGEVRTRFASQVHLNPNDTIIFLVLNTTVAPFNDLRVRRALNYAIDRTKMATLLGQHSRPTCQLLPPFITGYRRYCPYTLDPNVGRAWSAPDLATARRLIAASRTRGTRITIWSQPGYLTDFTTAGRYLVSLLDRLGYRAHAKAFAANNPSFGRCGDSRTRCQLAFSSWGPNYPAASEFIQFLASCQNLVPKSTSNSNWSQYCDPSLDATIRRALAAEGTNSPAAAQHWAQADKQVTDQALFVPLVTPSIIDFVSQRVGNYQYNAQIGVLLDQLWVH